jgi:hypothetical protein
MMMKMLKEGGLPVITDGLRHRDDDNPNGYFELEVVRQLKHGKVAWLEDVKGKGVKIISSLLEYLPPEYQYRIILMERDIRETVISQKKMLDHRDQALRMRDEEMEKQIQQHLATIKPWLVCQPNMEVLPVNYNAMMAAPDHYHARITDFLDIPLDPYRMLAVPDGQLYRNRVGIEE